jgi:hypothetical protein
VALGLGVSEAAGLVTVAAVNWARCRQPENPEMKAMKTKRNVHRLMEGPSQMNGLAYLVGRAAKARIVSGIIEDVKYRRGGSVAEEYWELVAEVGRHGVDT